MKILHIIRSCDPAEGGPIQGLLLQERITSDLYPEFERQILCCDVYDAPFLTNYPIKVNALGVSRKARWPWDRFLNHYRYSPLTTQWLRKNHKNFDAIFVHGLWNFSTLCASRVLPKSEVPYFVFSHGMMDPWFKKVAPVKFIVKQLSWLINEGKLASHANSLLFTCEEELLRARNVFFGHSYRETIVPYGTQEPPPRNQVEPQAFDQVTPMLKGRSYLLFLGRIHVKKGCDILLRAFANVSRIMQDVDLVIAGPDENNWIPALKDLAAQLGIRDRCHWTGPLYGDAKWGALYGAEAFILPSHQENFGIAVAEALACGTPVIISNKVNIWREIESDGAGIVGEDTVDGTAQSLRHWCALQPNSRNRMSESAKKCFSDRFNALYTVPRIVFMLREVLKPND